MTVFAIFVGIVCAGCLVTLLFKVVRNMGNWGSALGIELGKNLLEKKNISTDIVSMLSAFPVALAMVCVLAVFMFGIELSVPIVLEMYQVEDISFNRNAVKILNIMNTVAILCYGSLRIFQHIGVAEKTLKEQPWDKA